MSSPPTQRVSDDSNRIITSAANIDKSLRETKGVDFVSRMRDGLPKLPAVGGQEEISAKGATEEATVKICRFASKELQSRSHLDEDWVSRARFQYCDMTQREGLSRAVEYHHAFNGRIVSLANTVRLCVASITFQMHRSVDAA